MKIDTLFYFNPNQLHVDKTTNDKSQSKYSKSVIVTHHELLLLAVILPAELEVVLAIQSNIFPHLSNS